MPVGRIEVEGFEEVRAAFRRLGGAEMVKRLGEVHRRVGELVIAKAGGSYTGVGTGAGSTIRPSSSVRDVQLRVGGRHRARFGNWRQWGRTQMWPPPTTRPYLIGAAESAEDEILDLYIDGINSVAPPLRIERN